MEEMEPNRPVRVDSVVLALSGVGGEGLGFSRSAFEKLRFLEEPEVGRGLSLG